MADYTIPRDTVDWDVPLNAGLTDINTRLTTGENTNATQNTSISSLNASVASLQGSAGYQVYNVKNAPYNALGNGVSDDTIPIQAALNAANAAGGGVVYLPAGTYKISAALTLYNRITVRGDGDYVTNIVQSSTTANGFVGSSLIYIILEHFRLTGPGAGSGEGINFTTEFDYCILRDISATNWGSTGIEIEQPIVTNLTRVTSFSNGGAGIYIHGNVSTGAGTSVSFDSCWTHDNVSNGFSIENMTYCSFQACASDNHINSGKAGYLLNQCTAFTFSGCGSEGNNFGWELTGSTTGVVFNSPYIFNTPSTGIGIWVTGGTTNVQIIGSTEALPQGGAAAGIKVDTGCTATIQGAVTTTANVLASGTTVLAVNSAGVRSYPNGVTTPALAMTGPITMATSKITGLGNGSAAQDAAAFGQIPVAGTTAGTFTAGNDTRVTGALQAANNLSDVTTKVTGQNNLGIVGKACTANETNATTTQQASTQLALPVQASATYLMRAQVLFNTPNAVNFVHSWTGPAGATLVWSDSSGSSIATIGATDSWSSTGADKPFYLSGVLTVAGTAGNFTLTFASGTAANTATLRITSNVTLQRIA